MFDIDEALQQEITFCESFTNKTTTDFGIIYYNPLIPSSHDSNHAHILKINENPEKAIQEIIRFYRNLEITPRLYPSFIDNELKILKPYLESAGFTVDKHENTWMLFPQEPLPLADASISVRRITRVSEDIIELIHSDEDGDRTIKVLENHIKDEQFHLLGLFNSEKCVSIASVNTLDGYSRVDDVVTHMDYRGQHFGTKLINYLVRYHANISKNYLYLWAHNPIAIRMYKRVGFTEIPMDKPGWSAYIK